MWARRRWRFLLNVIDHLPRDSFYVEALLDSEEIAEQLIGSPLPPQRERASDWSGLRETMAQVVDALRILSANVVAIAGVKPPAVKPTPRPVTALDRVKKRRRRAEHDALVARVLPRR